MDLKKYLLKNIGISAIIIAAITGAIFFVKNDINGKADRMERAKTEAKKTGQSSQELADLEVDYKKAKGYEDSINSYYINKDQILTFSKDMSAMAKQNKLSLNLVFGGETPLSDLFPRKTNIIATLEGEATMVNFMDFLKVAENSRYFFGFKNIEVDISGNRLRANISGQVMSF